MVHLISYMRGWSKDFFIIHVLTKISHMLLIFYF